MFKQTTNDDSLQQNKTIQRFDFDHSFNKDGATKGPKP